MTSKMFVESYGDEVSRVFTLEKSQSRQISSLFDLHLSWVTLKKFFLPVGYPSSVSDDYLEYQIWDTIQAGIFFITKISLFSAFASSITGALASQAVLIGVGVGDSSATILSASLTWMFKDGSGMIGRIIFAGYHGIKLDCDCKFWRFVADILNDCALFLEIISPLFNYLFTPLLCLANVLKSLVGVAGSATRAAIVQHQAINNNLADVSAKDGSQETLSNLMAWLLNFILLYMVTGNQFLIWFCFICCTSIHLYSNYRAVKCLKLRTFNRTRFHLAIQQWFKQQFNDIQYSMLVSNNIDNINKIPKYLLMNQPFPHVIWVNESEPIIHKTDQPIIIMGCSLYKLPIEGQKLLPNLMQLCEKYNYILYCPNWEAVQQDYEFLQSTLNLVNQLWNPFINSLQSNHDWNMDSFQFAADIWRLHRNE
ncbi:hypothetical protein Smp_142110 [Schistosoma mansoni]|uniref:hypothetical protein n=1 Tax=Schistosoma mansoni TaxID=6183 RepID=UPI00022C86C2|nr:hypothetical protein Smp_142110 [Schistosoma mansoni]|eukprot:XP_018645119.1 hypothetical protein Smp_142110 [Schistosoma mansoni]